MEAIVLSPFPSSSNVLLAGSQGPLRDQEPWRAPLVVAPSSSVPSSVGGDRLARRLEPGGEGRGGGEAVAASATEPGKEKRNAVDDVVYHTIEGEVHSVLERNLKWPAFFILFVAATHISTYPPEVIPKSLGERDRRNGTTLFLSSSIPQNCLSSQEGELRPGKEKQQHAVFPL